MFHLIRFMHYKKRTVLSEQLSVNVLFKFSAGGGGGGATGPSSNNYFIDVAVSLGVESCCQNAKL